MFLRLVAFGRVPSRRSRAVRAALLSGAVAAASALTMTAQASPATRVLNASTSDNGDGHIDRVVVTFSGAMDTTTVPRAASAAGSPGFRVSGYDISSLQWGSSTTLWINLTPKSAYDTAATPELSYVSGGGGANAVALTGSPVEMDDYAASAVSDGAGPVLLSATSRDIGSASLFTTAGDSLELTFSEPATLAGVGALTRWQNIEKAVQLDNAGSGCADGDGTPSKFNFPQPTTGTDPITPAGSTTYLAQWTITAQTGNTLPPTAYRIPAVPAGCKIGVSSSSTLLITDGASNSAANQDLPAALAGARYVQPADATLVSARTLDGVTGAADGAVDAVQLTFDHNLDDATIPGAFSSIGVSLDGAAATVDTATADTGAVANDAIVVLHVSPPDGTAWAGGVRPVVSYARATSCRNEPGSGAVGDGLMARVPTAGAWRACVASFDATASDGVSPLVTGATTLDENGDGLLDHLRVSFTEPVSVGTAGGWSMDARNATAFAIDPADGRVATIGFPQGDAGDTGTLPMLRYARQATGATADAAGNQIPATGRLADVDAAAPRIRTASVRDANGDGSIDTAVLEYSEDIVSLAPDAISSFTVGGVAATSVAREPANTLTLAVPEIVGTDAKAIAFDASTSIADAAGNASGAQVLAADAVTDEAAPVGTIAISPSAPLSVGTSTVTATFSEPMGTSAAPTAMLGSKAIAPVGDADHTNGWRAADPRVWNGTVQIATSDCDQPRGCAVDATLDAARDTRGNAQTPAALATEIDTIAPAAPELGAVSAIEAPGEAAPANTLNMFTQAISVAASFAAADAEAGHLELLVDGVVLSPAATSPAISPVATGAVARTGFADADALQAAIPEGAHTIGARLCDDAGNCTNSLDAVDVVADYTPIHVDLSAPDGGDVVSGGQTLRIDWSGDAVPTDFDHVELDYSTDGGATYTRAIDHARPELTGSYSWKVPAIDAAEARVRAVTVDAKGNKAADESLDTFAIDSTAPVVRVVSPASSSPFLPSGGTATISWTVADASVDRVEDPMTIEYSTDAGSHWQQINGGDYSRADDGSESWKVPSGSGFTTMVRVTARDATGRTGRATSVKLARGVAGYVADRYGKAYAFGTADARTRVTSLGGDSARGIVMRRDRVSGFVLASKGGVYPFAAGNAAMPSKPKATGLGRDLARGIALRTDTTGYVVDAYGRVHPFGGASAAKTSSTWSGKDLARGIVMLSSLRGGYVLDAYGRLYPFAVGSYSMPRAISTTKLSSARAVAVVLRSNQTSGWVLDTYGKLTPFGGAPSRSSSGTGSSALARGLVRVTDDGGYWADHRGVLHAWGAAIGNPTRVTLASDRARGAAS